MKKREDIKRIAPIYKGKIEKFDPARVKSKKERAQTKPSELPAMQQQDNVPTQTKPTPRLLTLPKPALENENKTPTSQCNESIMSEAIFGPNVTVVPIVLRQQFEEQLAALPQLALEYVTQLIKEELSYYYTAML